jgi:predicted transcriptional regulator
MESSLEAVQFLANSANRVEVLTALVDGPTGRRELQEGVDASRSTVSRVLDEAETRGWVDSEGSRYWATPLGESLLLDFRSYLESVEGHRRLGDAVNHFPPPLFELDFRHLRDASLVESTVEDPSAPFTRALDLYGEATEYRGLNSTSLPRHERVLLEGAAAGDIAFGQVFERAFVETLLADPERASRWEPLSDRVWVHDGVVPINVQVVDDTVLVWLGKTRGEVAGLLESRNPAVLSWAEGLYEEYRRGAEPLSAVD